MTHTPTYYLTRTIVRYAAGFTFLAFVCAVVMIAPTLN